MFLQMESLRLLFLSLLLIQVEVPLFLDIQVLSQLIQMEVLRRFQSQTDVDLDVLLVLDFRFQSLV